MCNDPLLYALIATNTDQQQAELCLGPLNREVDRHRPKFGPINLEVNSIKSTIQINESWLNMYGINKYRVLVLQRNSKQFHVFKKL